MKLEDDLEQKIRVGVAGELPWTLKMALQELSIKMSASKKADRLLAESKKTLWRDDSDSIKEGTQDCLEFTQQEWDKPFDPKPHKP